MPGLGLPPGPCVCLGCGVASAGRACVCVRACRRACVRVYVCMCVAGGAAAENGHAGIPCRLMAQRDSDACMHLWMYIFSFTCMHLRMQVRMQVCVRVRIRIYSSTPTWMHLSSSYVHTCVSMHCLHAAGCGACVSYMGVRDKRLLVRVHLPVGCSRSRASCMAATRPPPPAPVP
jgi:hypothetical protein